MGVTSESSSQGGRAVHPTPGLSVEVAIVNDGPQTLVANRWEDCISAGGAETGFHVPSGDIGPSQERVWLARADGDFSVLTAYRYGVWRGIGDFDVFDMRITVNVSREGDNSMQFSVVDQDGKDSCHLFEIRAALDNEDRARAVISIAPAMN